jgi:hypothetical protein
MKEMRVIKTTNLFIGNLLFLVPACNRQASPLPYGERAGVRGVCFSIKDNNRPNLVPKNLFLFDSK